MVSTRSSFWYRNAWWLPAGFTVMSVPLLGAAMRPSEQSILLAVAILFALPWSLALLLLDLSQGFADRAAMIVVFGLCANVALVWWGTALLRARALRRGDRALGPLEA